MKKLLYACALLLFISAIAACTMQDADTPAATDTRPTIMSIGPAITEIIVGLGAGDRIIATDTFSAQVPGVPAGIPIVDMWNLDIEIVLMAEADMVLANEMIMFSGDPLAAAAEAGAAVVYLPGFSESIGDIKDNIRFIAATLGIPGTADTLIGTMEAEIEQARTIGETITHRRTVYFELDAPPDMFSFGSNTFLGEILEIIGAVNIFADHGAFVPVSDEQVIVANPDVILTNVPFGTPAEIKARNGWGGIAAVENSRIFTIDSDASSRDSQKIIDAMWEIAHAVYPEYFD